MLSQTNQNQKCDSQPLWKTYAKKYICDTCYQKNYRVKRQFLFNAKLAIFRLINKCQDSYQLFNLNLTQSTLPDYPGTFV